MTKKGVIGDICSTNSCHFCCIETEMLLSKTDIKRISSTTGNSAEKFSLLTEEGFHVLKNKTVEDEQRCFFLGVHGKCEIYSIRPEGCQYYPCIWDLNNHEPFTDDVCPYHEQFENQLEKIRDGLELFVLKVIGQL